jgi:3-oxo-5alpha-steroid 4-dehydrogenase
MDPSKKKLPVGADPGDLILEVADKAEKWGAFLSSVPGRIDTCRKAIKAGKADPDFFKDKERNYDVIVVGYGSAGAAAALEAAAGGARVLVIDGSVGGGSTQRSGGVIYLGGGTQSQLDAGFDDDADNMYNCLKIDTEGAVDDDRLRAFCNESKANFDWMRDNGVRFADPATGKSVYWKKKASLPPGDSTLYWSGNEEAEPWCRAARPAPRGHWPWFPGCGDDVIKQKVQAPMRGFALFNALANSVDENDNIDVFPHCKGIKLITDASGRVVGLRVKELPDLPAMRLMNQMLYGVGTMTEYDMSGNAKRETMRLSESLFEEFGTEYEVTAGKGVIITAGGYFFNEKMVAKYNPERVGNMPLGNMGDNGSGIGLGEEIGGKLHMMSRATTWKFMAPPNGFLCGIFVDTVAARRFSNEDVYNAKLMDRQFARAGGKAWCLIDHALYKEIEDEVEDGDNELYGFQRALSVIMLKAGSRTANTWAELAGLCGLPVESLEDTVKRYNDDASRGGDTNFGKAPKYVRPLVEPPFTAVWVDVTIGAMPKALIEAMPITAPTWMPSWMPMLPVIKAAIDSGIAIPPSPTFSLGGLHVDIAQRALREGNMEPIPGLYAAGRSAAGVASGGYVSGLSIADAVFSGRRAGRHATMGTADPVTASATLSANATKAKSKL